MCPMEKHSYVASPGSVFSASEYVLQLKLLVHILSGRVNPARACERRRSERKARLDIIGID